MRKSHGLVVKNHRVYIVYGLLLLTFWRFRYLHGPASENDAVARLVYRTGRAPLFQAIRGQSKGSGTRYSCFQKRGKTHHIRGRAAVLLSHKLSAHVVSGASIYAQDSSG